MFEQQTTTIEQAEPVADTNVEAPEQEAEEIVDQHEPEAAADDGEGIAEGAESVIQEVEVEINGKKYKVHPDIKDGYLRNAAFTQGMQQNAETKRELAARAAALDQARQVSEQEFNARVHKAKLEAEIESYAGVDFQRLWAESPSQAGMLSQRLQMLRDEQARTETALGEMQQYQSQMAEQAIATRLEETRKFAEREIPGWNPEVDAKIQQFAEKELGFQEGELRAAYSPQVYRALWLAQLGFETLTKSTAVKPAAGRASSIKPLTTVGQKSSGVSTTMDPSEMKMEDYAKWAARKFKD